MGFDGALWKGLFGVGVRLKWVGNCGIFGEYGGWGLFFGGLGLGFGFLVIL